MKTFTKWLITEMGYIPVASVGQQAENVFHTLMDTLKPGNPGQKLTIIYTIPTKGVFTKDGFENKEGVFHTYSYTVEISSEGKWITTSNSQFAGYDNLHGGGPWFGEENASKAIEGAVSDTYFHKGKLWYIGADGVKKQIKE